MFITVLIKARVFPIQIQGNLVSALPFYLCNTFQYCSFIYIQVYQVNHFLQVSLPHTVLFYFFFFSVRTTCTTHLIVLDLILLIILCTFRVSYFFLLLKAQFPLHTPFLNSSNHHFVRFKTTLVPLQILALRISVLKILIANIMNVFSRLFGSLLEYGDSQKVIITQLMKYFLWVRQCAVKSKFYLKIKWFVF